MWRMTTVAIVAGLVYLFAGAWQRSAEPPVRDVSAFGQPWTLAEIEAELTRAGLHVELDAPDAVERFDVLPASDDDPILPGPFVLVRGKIEGFPAAIWVYPSAAQRELTWREDGDIVFLKGYAFIESAPFGVANAVIDVGSLVAPPDAGDLGAVRAAILALRD